MAKSTFFHLSLTGYVGSRTFNAADTRKVLAQYPGKHVDILIDSFGGSLPEGLSICGAIRDHGDVTVHFRGMSASAATIASMGARHIEMAPEAMYLVHKVSMEFFDWASRNADQLDDFIKALQEAKKDLDTMDLSIAQLYASRCKKPVKDLLDLMRAEKWITAQQALEWGFIDEISDDSQSEAKLTREQAYAFKALGLPLPPVDIESESKSLVATIVDAVKNILPDFKMDHQNSQQTQQPKEQPSGQQPAGQPENAGQQQQQQQTPPDEGATPRNDSSSVTREEFNQLKDSIARIEAAIAPQSPKQTTNVVATPEKNEQEQKPQDNAFTRFCNTSKSAYDLFKKLP